MSIQDWGAIGEIVGALAVLLTLVYFAKQVVDSKGAFDANTNAIRGRVLSDVTKNVHDHMMMIVQGKDLATVWQKMATQEHLSSDDKVLLDMLLTAMFVARQNEYYLWKQGLLDESVFRSLHHITFGVLRTPSGQQWWHTEGSKLVAPEFASYVNQLDVDGPSTPAS